MKSSTLSIAFIAALTLTACATTEQKMLEAGATRLNAAQVKTYIINKTERWSEGGGFYSPDGTLETVWKGSMQEGPYTIADDGKVCYDVKTWDRECHFYMNDNGKIVMIYKRKNVGAREMLDGNQLANL